MENKPQSKPVTSTLALLIPVGGELYLLRGLPAAGAISGILLAEFGFCILIVAGAIFAATPSGWRSKTGSYIALALYTVYLSFNILCFTYFRELYQSVIVTEHQSYGAAMEALKLVLILIGTVAAIPVIPGPEGREYMRGLERAVRRQQLEWAKAGAQGAKSDLDKTVRRLRENLSPEELSELMAQLKREQPSEEVSRPEADTVSVSEVPPEASRSEELSAEDWRGCG